MANQNEPSMAVDGQQLKELVRASLAWLRLHQEAVNVLNVFPVPDGDTGTNMVLTMQSAWDEVADSTETRAGELMQKVAHGALMGARGNSGVILSQIWRGLARGLDGNETFTAADLARALKAGTETAYKGVIHPVEGTILTVVREAAEEAAAATGKPGDLIATMERIVARAQDAVSRTPQMLDVLAEAGVVDAGGQGLFVILEGMLRQLRGQEVGEHAELDHLAGAVAAGVPVEEMYGYDVQFIIAGKDLDVETIRESIDAMGDSTLVVGDAATIKVHVHVPDPGVPISYAVQLGSLRDVVVEDMQAQYQEFIAKQQQLQPVVPAVDTGDISIVAVAPGDGLARVLASLGVAAIIPGGQTMNPSTEQILQAVDGVANDQVIVLPNNKNIVLAAEQARDLSDKQVVVVPTRTIPQGISALLAFNYQTGLEQNAQEMGQAAREVQTGEVTTATRDVCINSVTVCEGQIIGICNGELAVSGESIESVTKELLEEMGARDLEIITLYYGGDISEDAAQDLAQGLEAGFPDQEFEVIEGGQPHYFYIISAE